MKAKVLLMVAALVIGVVIIVLLCYTPTDAEKRLHDCFEKSCAGLSGEALKLCKRDCFLINSP